MFSILYNYSSKNVPQQWQIFVEGDSYYTVSGQVNGKLTTTAKTKCEPKNVGRANATTAEEQALSEAQSKFQKKLDEGYRESLEEAEKVVFKEPMLAHKWVDRKKYILTDSGNLTELVYIQPKLDGLRMILSSSQCLSRKGKPFVSVPHIQEEALKWIFSKFPNVVLDGELYNHDFKDNFNALTSLTKQTKPNLNDLDLSKHFVEYHVYDIQHPNWTFRQRNEFLCNMFVFVPKESCLKLVRSTCASTVSEIESSLQHHLELGYEGIMIRRDMQYEFKRSNSLLKYKEFIDDEFEIISYGCGVGEREGCYIPVMKTKEGKVFKGSIKGTVEYSRSLYQQKDTLIGKFATVRYQNLTPDGIPRFPVVHSIRDYE